MRRAGASACGRLARVLGRVQGFSLTEALATVLIVGMVTAILAGGIGLASRQYTQQMASSEAQMLYSSLQKILDTELRFTKTITVNQESGQVTGFFSKHYTAKADGESGLTGTSELCTVTNGPNSTVAYSPSTPGQLGMASAIGADVSVNTFLGEGSYNYGLQASIPSITYDAGGNYFTVNLMISKAGESLVNETFTVYALNLSNVTTGGGSGSGSTEGGTTTPGTSLPVIENGTNTYQLPYIELPAKDQNGNYVSIGAGSVVKTSDDGGAYFVVNKPIDGNFNPSDDKNNSNGNSDRVVRIQLDSKGNPIIVETATSETPIGTLCKDKATGKLYILVFKTGNGNNVKQPPESGWLEITTAKPVQQGS